MDMPPQPKLISPSKQLAFVLGQRVSFSRFPSPPPPPSSGRRHPGVRIWPLRRPGFAARRLASSPPVASASPLSPQACHVVGPVTPSCAHLVARRPCSGQSPPSARRPSSARASLRPSPGSAALLPPSPSEQGWNDETNTVIADDEWWKKAGEENKDFLQFRKCGPDNLEEMSIMYENINVTGESSMMPGCELEVLDLEDEIEEIEGTQAKKAKKLPVKIDGTSSKKNPVQRDFKRMVDHLISEDAAMNSHKNSVATEIEKIMEDVVACGADEQSDEYFIATLL
ncbi:hypothetical protein ZWY2020_020410 [Hordeum vulgare]|nr:hypothetical protein ZWY2020_020410 [Hordeum vulgare]